MTIDLVITQHLLVATLTGGLIGLERTLRRKPAGLRTHILVSVGAALIMMVSMHMSELYPGADVDASRIASNVVAGLGFLGAGTIIRYGSNIHGLTTAASIWATGGIGLAAGCGFYEAAIQTTIVILVVLELLDLFERRVTGKPGALPKRHFFGD